MLEWKESILLDADIDKVWALFELENLPKLCPMSFRPLQLRLRRELWEVPTNRSIEKASVPWNMW